MACFFCKGSMGIDTTTHVVDLGKTIIIIRNVPCKKCTQCGNVGYTLDVAERLEKIVDTLKNSITELAVVHYTDNVA